MLYRPHQLYLFLAVAGLGMILFVPPENRPSAVVVTFIVGLILAFYLRASSRRSAGELIRRVAEGDETAARLYRARVRSRFGDEAREYLETLLGTSDERLLPLLVGQLGHPDPAAREMVEDRLVRWGVEAADPLVRAALGRELSGDGAFRARRLLWRMRSELPEHLSALLEASGYWQDT